MASDEPFSGILPGWVARRALRIRARPVGASPTSLGPTEPVAAPSRRVVQQLAAPVQLDEEWRVAPCRHDGEHDSTGDITVVSYRATSVCGGRASRVCGRASRACGSAMQTKTEAGCVESDQSVAIFSLSTAIIEGKYNTGGRRHLGPMKATAEATTADSGGFFAALSLPRTFVDPASV